MGARKLTDDLFPLAAQSTASAQQFQPALAPDPLRPPATTEDGSRLYARGVTLLETMIAAMILVIAISALMNLLSYAVVRNKTQGEVSSVDTALCASRMERLMSLSFTDAQLCGAMAANTTCGSIYPSAPVTNYVTYFDSKGSSLGSNPVGAMYMRQWMISTGSDVNAKTISVSSVGPGLGPGAVPYTVVVGVKVNF